MTLIEDIAGEICKIVFPIETEIFYGNKTSNVALCTLSDIQLLKEISTSSILQDVAIAGRLFSENKGIDALVNYVISKQHIDTIIICGKDTPGHKAGHSLLCLYKNGVDNNHRIIGSQSPHPELSLMTSQVVKFQNQVQIINKIGLENISELKTIIGQYKKN